MQLVITYRMAHCRTIYPWSFWEFSTPNLIVPVWSKDPVSVLCACNITLKLFKLSTHHRQIFLKGTWLWPWHDDWCLHFMDKSSKDAHNHTSLNFRRYSMTYNEANISLRPCAASLSLAVNWAQLCTPPRSTYLICHGNPTKKPISKGYAVHQAPYQLWQTSNFH